MEGDLNPALLDPVPNSIDHEPILLNHLFNGDVFGDALLRFESLGHLPHSMGLFRTPQISELFADEHELAGE